MVFQYKVFDSGVMSSDAVQYRCKPEVRAMLSRSRVPRSVYLATCGKVIFSLICAWTKPLISEIIASDARSTTRKGACVLAIWESLAATSQTPLLPSLHTRPPPDHILGLIYSTQAGTDFPTIPISQAMADESLPRLGHTVDGKKQENIPSIHKVTLTSALGT